MTAKTLDQLEADEQAAQRKAEAARQAAEAARQKAQEQRQQRLDAHDRRLVDAHDQAQLEQDVRDAQRALDEAVAASTLGQAWVALKAAQLRRAYLSTEAHAAANRIGDSRSIEVPPAQSAVPEELTRAVDRVAAAIAADEADARETARDAAGEG